MINRAAIANTRFLPLTFTLVSRSHKNDPQYPVHHDTYAPAKFEVATPNCLGNAVTRQCIK